MTEINGRIRISDTPMYVQYREYIHLRNQDRLILRQGKHYAIQNHELRPVHIAWSRC